MANIKIPGYRELIPNSTFGKRTTTEVPIFGTVPSTFVTQIARYQVASPKQIIETIQNAAMEYQGMSEEERRIETPKGQIVPVSKFMRGLPEEEVKMIALGDSDSINHLKEHYQDQGLESGRFYLQITNGTIPDVILKHKKAEILDLGFAGYEGLLENENSGHWYLRLRLPEGDRLPERNQIESLLEAGVKDSLVFCTSGFKRGYSEFAEYFRNIYDALAKDKNVSKIEDNSQVFLDSRAALTIKYTTNCIRRQMEIGSVVENLPEILGGIMENISGHERGPGYRFDPNKHSNN